MRMSTLANSADELVHSESCSHQASIGGLEMIPTTEQVDRGRAGSGIHRGFGLERIDCSQ